MEQPSTIPKWIQPNIQSPTDKQGVCTCILCVCTCILCVCTYYICPCVCILMFAVYVQNQFIIVVVYTYFSMYNNHLCMLFIIYLHRCTYAPIFCRYQPAADEYYTHIFPYMCRIYQHIIFVSMVTSFTAHCCQLRV